MSEPLPGTPGNPARKEHLFPPESSLPPAPHPPSSTGDIPFPSESAGSSIQDGEIAGPGGVIGGKESSEDFLDPSSLRTSLDPENLFVVEEVEEGADVGEEASQMGEAGTDPEPLMRGRTFISSLVSYQSPDEEAEGQPVQFAYINSSDEQPYKREGKIGQSWEQLDAGWFKDAIQEFTDPATGQPSSRPLPVVLQIINRETGPRGRQPTPEELADLSGRIIEVGYALAVPSSPTPEEEEERQRRKQSRTMWDDPEPDSRSGGKKVRVVAQAMHYIPPGEDCRINPHDLSTIYLRCVRGKARYVLRIIPR